MRYTPFILLASLATAALHAQPVAIHQWNFDEPAGTAIQQTVNSGSEASANLPTWSAFTNGGAETDWKTNGAGGLKIAKNRNDANTLVQSIATMADLVGEVRFEWDVSWNWTTTAAIIRETYLINRNAGGTNRFRWTISNPSGADPTAAPLMRLNLDGNGFATINNVTAVQHETPLDGASGNLRLRVDFTLEGGQVVAVAPSYSYNGGDFVAINIGTFTPYALTNLNELRLHSKGIHDADNYLTFNSVTVSRLTPPPPPPEPVNLPNLGAAKHKWEFDEAAGTDVGQTANSGTDAVSGAPRLVGENGYNPPIAYLTDGSGKLVLNGWNAGSVVNTLAQLGPQTTGEVWMRWDFSWDYRDTSTSVNRRVFMNHRPTGGPSAGDNLIRFSLENTVAGTVSLGMSTAITAENTNVLGKTLPLNGSLSAIGAMTWNEQGEVTSIKAYYSEDGTTFYEIALPPVATPFAVNSATGYATTDLGDIRFNAAGNFEGSNKFMLDRLQVWVVGSPAAGGYSAWANGFSLDPNGNGAPEADADGDGVKNLLEYAMGTSPIDRTPMPTAELINGYLTLAYTRSPAATDVTLVAKTAADLGGPWTTEGVTDTLVDTVQGIEDREAKVLADGVRRFLRLEATPILP
jgi:hypothetical protein